MDIRDYLSSKKQIVDKFLDSYMPPDDAYPQEIHRAMRYSLFAGGKRIRPILSIASFEAIREDSSMILPVACSIELIHTYSLIHDDLPSMDNDDFRRGKPTNHRVFGEAVAILAGDALLTLAFSMMTDSAYVLKLDNEHILQVVNEISSASGYKGMVGGQVVDILSEGRDIDFNTLEYIHVNKTGAIIRASVRAGGILAGADKSHLNALTSYGENLGLAFQITDDILDIEGKKEDIGKNTGMDIKKGKKTYPGIIGMDESKKKVNELIEDSIGAISIFDDKADPLREIAKFIINRKN